MGAGKEMSIWWPGEGAGGGDNALSIVNIISILSMTFFPFEILSDYIYIVVVVRIKAVLDSL